VIDRGYTVFLATNVDIFFISTQLINYFIFLFPFFLNLAFVSLSAFYLIHDAHDVYFYICYLLNVK